MALLESVIGHKALIKNLREAVSTKRLRGTHLFAGPSGVGKKMIALGLAQVYLCPERQNAQACGQCPSCLKIQKQQSESVFLLKPEGAQIKIDEVRALIDFLSLKSWHNGQVVIIDGAETLNSQAANALLKSLEEPPESTLIFLITSTASALLPTVRSRCQLWRFSPLSFAELKSLTNGPDWLVEAAQGSLELAQVLSEREDGEFRTEAFWVWSEFFEGRLQSAISAAKELLKERQQVSLVSRLWQQIFRDGQLMTVAPDRVIHRDKVSLLQLLATQPRELLDFLFVQSIELEEAHSRHWDCSLMVENMLYQAGVQREKLL